MKLSKQNLCNDQPKTLSKQDDKKSININWNSSLFFQVGLILSLLLVYFIMQTNFENKAKPVALSHSLFLEEPMIFSYSVKEPEKIPQKKQKPKKVFETPKVLNEVEKTDNNSAKETDISHLDETKEKDQPLTDVKPLTNAEKKPNNGIENLFAVEFVPIYPGCEGLSSNNEKRECMQEHIKKFIKKKFKTEKFEESDIKGKQIIRVRFNINEKGEVSDVFAKTDHYFLEEEAIRVISNLPKMKPGKQGDKAVKVQYILPIMLKID